ncbi:lamin tail domain-containing protein [Amycolatopsis aidingensis]|uniref:lamin tail domain-containing protein n=1 Tax=Amycolatopsis aidingensis TaxID=2842453 RepID=UPI001C0CCB7D|nr:lamin tail domain-containing protein [Amycolatopsis aidingensis]
MKIDELLPGPAGFVVLHNTSPDPVHLGGWSIRSCSGTGSTELAVVPVGSFVPGDGDYVVTGGGFAGSVEAHLVVDSVAGNGLMLLDQSRKRVDGLGFAPDTPCRENRAARLCDHLSLGRDENSTDTDDNLSDFTCQAPRPGITPTE